MSFEYKIIANFTKKQIVEIKAILETNKEFEKKYEFDTKIFWNFRQLGNKGKMPNISVSFENDGIYICRYDGSYVWKNLKEVKEYIDDQNSSYVLLDYQE